MDFNEYQKRAKETAIYPKMNPSWTFPAIGLSGETGELMEKLKKIIRDSDLKVTDEKLDSIKKELGDILWYLSAITTELNLSLDEIANDNIAKINSRKQRAVIKGEGDYR